MSLDKTQKPLVLVEPGEWSKFVVDIRQCREVKVAKVTLGEEVAGNLERLGGLETLNPGFFVLRLANRTVKLAVSVDGDVDRLERDKLGWVRGQIQSVLLVAPGRRVNTLNLVQRAG